MSNDGNSDVLKLIEQANFLLEKQKEAHRHTTSLFKDFLSLVSEKSKSASEEDAVKLGTIAKIVQEQLDHFEKEITEDIGFLSDQVKALEEINNQKDPHAAQKLVALLMEGREVPDTENFKKEVQAEAESSKNSFAGVIGDLKNSLAEGGIDDLLSYLSVSVETAAPSSEDTKGCCNEGAGPDMDKIFEKANNECCGKKGACGDKCVCAEGCNCQ